MRSGSGCRHLGNSSLARRVALDGGGYCPGRDAGAARAAGRRARARRRPACARTPVILVAVGAGDVLIFDPTSRSPTGRPTDRSLALFFSVARDDTRDGRATGDRPAAGVPSTDRLTDRLLSPKRQVRMWPDRVQREIGVDAERRVLVAVSRAFFF